MTAVLIGILFLIILIIGHEFGHFFAAKIFGLRVDEFGFGFPPRIFSRKKGETIYSFNLLPFGGFVKIHGEHAGLEEKLEEPERSFTHQSALRRAIIIVSGALMNFLIGWIAFSIVFSLGVPNRVVIEEVVPDSPAASAGFQIGQTVDGFSSAEEFSGFVHMRHGEEITVNGAVIALRESFPEGEGPLGVTVTDVGIERQGVLQSISSGFISAAGTTWLIVEAFAGFLGSIFGGDFDVVGQIAGPVGVFSMLDEVKTFGLTSLVQFLGLISLNLVVINLIPFPALDGGRFASVVVEKIIGRRLNYKFEMIINAFGLALLLLLMVVVTIRDIINIL